MKKALYILIFTLILGCVHKNKSDAVKKVDTTLCEKFNEKYIEFSINNKIDSAYFYLNRAIKCNPENESFKYEKISFLIKNKEYNKALKDLDNIIITSKDITYQFLKSIILYRINDSKAKVELDKVYSEVSKKSESNFTYLTYKILLDNYFKGKEYALSEITSIDTEKIGIAEKQTLKYLQTKIKDSEKPMDIIFDMFDIE